MLVLYGHYPNSFGPPPLCQTGKREKSAQNHPEKPLHPPPFRAMPIWKQYISKRGFPQPRVYQLMLVTIFLTFKCLTRGCQCERWWWWRSKKGPGKSSFIFLFHIYNIHRSRISPSVQKEKEERFLFWYFLNISVRICTRRKKKNICSFIS